MEKNGRKSTITSKYVPIQWQLAVAIGTFTSVQSNLENFGNTELLVTNLINN